MTENSGALKERGFSEVDIEKLSISELIDCIEEWVGRNV